jgi:hypothetical protein
MSLPASLKPSSPTEFRAIMRKQENRFHSALRGVVARSDAFRNLHAVRIPDQPQPGSPIRGFKIISRTRHTHVPLRSLCFIVRHQIKRK